MRIVNPSFGQEAPSTETVSANAVDWKHDPIILFSNSKPNAKELLEGVRDQMGAYRNTDNIDYIAKDTAAQGAPEAMYDELATKYRAALLAIAD
jgi:thioredoxin reductase (NADPH)